MYHKKFSIHIRNICDQQLHSRAPCCAHHAMPESSRSVQLWLFTGMERQESARGLISYHARSANRPAFCQPQSSPHSWCRGSRPPNGRKAFSPWLTNSKNETWIEEKENQGRTDRDGKWRREGKGREGPHHGAGTSPNSESCVCFESIPVKHIRGLVEKTKLGDRVEDLFSSQGQRLVAMR